MPNTEKKNSTEKDEEETLPIYTRQDTDAIQDILQNEASTLEILRNFLTFNTTSEKNTTEQDVESGLSDEGETLPIYTRRDTPAPQNELSTVETQKSVTTDERDIESGLLYEEETLPDTPATQDAPQNELSTSETLKSFLSFVTTPDNLQKIVKAQGVNILQAASNVSSSLFFAKTAIAAFDEKQSAEIAGIELPLEALATLMAASFALSLIARAQIQKIIAPVKADIYERAVTKSIEMQLNQKHEVNIRQELYAQIAPIQNSMGGPEGVEALFADIASTFINAMASSVIISMITGLPLIGVSTLVTMLVCTLYGATKVSDFVQAKSNLMKRNNDVWTNALSVLETKALIHNYGQQSRTMAETEATDKNYGNALVNKENTIANTTQGHISITGVISILVGLYGSYQVKGGTLSPTNFLFMLGQLLRNLQIMPDFGKGITSLLGAISERAIVEKAWRDQTTQMTDEYKDIKLVIEKSEHPAIEFKNVTFVYPKSGETLFNNLSFKIDPGEVVALVSGSGAGKTTILNLISGLFKVNEGSIEINGQDISKVSRESLWENITYVGQNAQLLSGTIETNIKFGTKTPENKDVDAIIVEKAKALGIDKFFKESPKGVKRDVGDKGQLLSGGQKQRVELMRAALKEGNILLLDEITASLDSLSATQILTNSNVLAKSNAPYATIMITHKLKEVQRFATRVIVIDKGQIIAIGTHNDLEKNCEFYQTLLNKEKAEKAAHLNLKMKGQMGNNSNQSTSSTHDIKTKNKKEPSAVNQKTGDEENPGNSPGM